ncbi:hypothetical protein D9M71_743380 [compost metagenome]
MLNRPSGQVVAPVLLKLRIFSFGMRSTFGINPSCGLSSSLMVSMRVRCLRCSTARGVNLIRLLIRRRVRR